MQTETSCRTDTSHSSLEPATTGIADPYLALFWHANGQSRLPALKLSQGTVLVRVAVLRVARRAGYSYSRLHRAVPATPPASCPSLGRCRLATRPG